MEADRTALLIIDMQNVFLKKGAVSEIALGRDIVKKISNLVKFCRRAKIPVFWIMADHGAPHGGLIYERVYRHADPEDVPQRIGSRWSEGFQLYETMPKPLQGERMIVKNKYDAFYQTNLDLLLRSMKRDTVIITGVGTAVCCESTARSAFSLDYKVIFTSDGTAARSLETHNATLAIMASNFGRVMKVDEVIGELEKTEHSR